MLSGLRAARHAEADALLGRLPAVAGGHVSGEERVAGADRRHRLERVKGRPVEAPLRIPQKGEAAGGTRHDRLTRAELGDLVEAGEAVLVVGELVPHYLLRLELVWGDDTRLRTGAEQHRVAL